MKQTWMQRLPSPLTLLLLSLPLLLGYLVLRNAGPYPMVFADEWAYSSYARLQPLAEAVVPSYLYLALFRLTSSCGDQFLQCARIGNALLLVAAAPFLYALARRYCSAAVAAGVALLALLAPFNSYTVYFMPEAMYFFGFAVLSWAMLAGVERPQFAWAAACGLLLGLMSLVKVHALFLLPAMLLFVLYAWLRVHGRAGVLPGLAGAALLLAAMLAAKLGLGYLLADRAGLSLLGSFYGGHANNTAGFGHLLATLMAAVHSLAGHLLSLALLFGVPLAAMLLHAFSPAQRAPARAATPLLVYTLLSLGAAIGMTVLYTGTIANAGPLEGVRLHLRYYDFAFPLLLIAGAALLAAPDAKAALPLRLPLAVLAAVAVLASRLLATHYAPSFIDGPELQGMQADNQFMPLPMLEWLPLLQLPLLALWVWRPRWALLAFLFVLTPVTYYSAERATSKRLQDASAATSYDQAGKFVHQFLSAGQRASLGIVGDDMASIMRAMFHVDALGIAPIILPPDAPFDLTRVPADKEWLLVVGQHPLPERIQPVVRTPGYTLARLPLPGNMLASMDFSAPALDLLSGVRGLGGAEHWGRWSLGKTVELTFAEPLPRRARLILRGHAYGPNAGQWFSASVGGQQLRFQVGVDDQDITLDFDTDGTARVLTITVPQPTAPDGLGSGADQRQLGIGLRRLQLGEQTGS
jgi:phosphoglycerol transferase